MILETWSQQIDQTYTKIGLWLLNDKQKNQLKWTLQPDLITNFTQIESDFLWIYNEITNQKFNNRINIFNASNPYKRINWRSAAMQRRILFWKNKIWIREMPVYQMFYELSHEVWHTIKPQLEKLDLHAEEIKAILFQYIFSKKIKESNLAWKYEFEKFERYRIEHIHRKDPETYAQYHTIAKEIAELSNYCFEIWVNLLIERLKRTYWSHKVKLFVKY